MYKKMLELSGVAANVCKNCVNEECQMHRLAVQKQKLQMDEDDTLDILINCQNFRHNCGIESKDTFLF